MKRSDELKNVLSLYTVSDNSTDALNEVKSAVMSVSIPKSVPVFSLPRFLKSLLFTLRLSFWLLCIAYIVIVSLVAITQNTSNAVIALCTATPFLTIAAVPTLFYNNNPGCMELESSCLYQPKAVFAGKSILCGCFDLIAVLICSIVCSFCGGVGILSSIVWGLLSFTAASVITLSFCVFFRTQTAMLLSVGVFCMAIGFMSGNTELSRAVLSIGMLKLFMMIILFAAVTSIIIVYTLRKYDYERSCSKIGY